MKKILCALLCATMLVGVAGCSSMTPSEEIAATTKAFTAEEIKANLTAGAVAEQNNIVYQYVANSVQIDKDKLVAVEQSDADLIKDKIKEVNEALRTGVTVYKDKTTEVSTSTQPVTAESSSTDDETSDSNTSPTAETSKTSQTSQTSQSTSSDNEVAEVEQVSDITIVSDSIANYMLYNFAITPYTWQMTDCKIVGMDSATHLYFVDVYYETTSEKKTVLKDSTLVKGQPGYDNLVEQRYTEYLAVMALAGTESVSKQYNEAKADFEKKWGKIEDIAASLEFEGPLDYTRKYGKDKKGIGCYTFSGTNNTYKIDGAKMVYRYVMGYNYNVNNEITIEPKAVYMYNYSINNAEALKTTHTVEETNGEEVLSPLVNKLIYSYAKALDECDNEGLYELYKSYSKYDTEVGMYHRYAYHKLGSYLFDILGRQGDKLYVEVTFSNKERTKGSAMSEASYKDSKLMTILINEDDSLSLIDICTLERTLVGEPLSVIEKVTGVSEQINYSENAFTATNEKAVQQTIANFMQLELTKNFSSEVFTNCIDLGISSSELENIKKTINSVDVNEVTSWVTGYSSKSNLYVLATLREVYVGASSGDIFETSANIGLINRNGKWFVVSYNRTMNVKLNKGTTISDEKCIEHYRIADGKVTSVKKEVAKVVEESKEG